MSVTNKYKQNVKELNAFLRKFKRFPKREEPLGHWCAQQKYLYKKGKLSDAKIHLLEPSGLLKTGDYNILLRADLIQQFLNEHERFPYRDERIRGVSIGVWWYKIQVQVEQFLIPEEVRTQIRIKYPMLYATAMDRKNKRFYEWVSLLTQYQLATGEIQPKNREKYMGRWLGDWCTRQRTLAKRGKLSEEKWRILSEKKVITEPFVAHPCSGSP